MQVVIHDKGKLLADHAVKNARARIAATFSKFGHKVISVQLLTEGASGGRGADVRARLLVKLAKTANVATTVRECSLSKAIFLSIERAERAVNRKLQRQSSRKSARQRLLPTAV